MRNATHHDKEAPMPQPGRYASAVKRQAAYWAHCRVQRERELTAKGLPHLTAVPEIPGTARWKATLKQARVLLETVHDEMQTYYDERSEAWQDSDRAETLLQRTEPIEEVLDQLDDLSNW